MGRTRGFVDKVKERFRSRSQSPSPRVGRRKDSKGQTTTPTSQPGAGALVARPNSSYSETSTKHAHGCLPPDLSPLAAGGNKPTGGEVVAVPSGKHGSPFPPYIQGSPSASVPAIRVSHSQPELSTSENPVSTSTCVPQIPTSASQVQGLDKTDAHLVHPQTKSTPGPDLIKPSPHSSVVVWAKVLDIVKKKLGDNNLPPLDVMNLTSQSAEESIGAVVTALKTLQNDGKRKRWRLTWGDKEFIIVEHFGKILKYMEKYSRLVDTAIQHSPQVTALVWTGVRAILQVCISYILQCRLIKLTP